VGSAALLGLAACSARPPAPRVQGPLPPTASAGTPRGRLIVAAHPDDDLFFMSPDLVGDVRQPDAGTTGVYVTAGDAGKDYGYWSGRVTGAEAAYAQMAGVPSEWRTTALRASGHVVDVHTLRAAPWIRLVFLHLPDGGIDGAGFPMTGHESLLRLLSGDDRSLHTIEGRDQAYSADALRAVLADVIRWSEPDLIRTLDYTEPPGGRDDHPDHRATALLTREAAEEASPTVPLVPYLGYEIADRPANVTGDELAAKQAAFLAYAPHDADMCTTLEACSTRPEGSWLHREYRAA
jgi:LmbE family N-acetylglucosaminyl deacetylase